ncbi:MAG TPA: type 1 glutamine amidotransferase domain-containing protein [Alphaproteobacteria bacterium]|nr:type 1 glutamine amidotransferase domain-containing protein [Alphaproteobacteria bacterium]
MAKTILMVLTSHGRIDADHPTGFWFEEMAEPYMAFVEAGFAVDIASIAGGEPPADPRSLEAPLPDSVARFRADPAAMAKLAATPALEAVDTARYDAIFLAGGHGTMWDFPESEALARAVAEGLAAGRVVAAVCHGPAGLVAARGADGRPAIAGRRVAGFTNGEEAAVGLTGAVPFLLEDRLKDCGGLYEKGPDFQPFAIADGTLVTGQNPASSLAVARLVRDILEPAPKP